MTKLTTEGIHQIEESLDQHETIQRVRDIPDFSFMDVEEISEGQRQGFFVISATTQGCYWRGLSKTVC